MSNWAEGIEHASITAENREAFNTAASKFESQSDMCVGYMELQKTAGKPFKFPDSMDKLPDDVSRSDFTSQANKLLGREFAADIAGLSDLNMKLGSTNEDAIDEVAANALKQMVVDKVIDKKQAQALVEFHNKSVGTARTANTTAATAAEEKATVQRATDVAACNTALVTHFGNQSEVDKQTVLLHRALVNNVGCSVDEAADIAEFLKEGEGATNVALRRVLLTQLAPLAAEAGSHFGKGGTPPSAEETIKEQLPATAKAMNW